MRPSNYKKAFESEKKKENATFEKAFVHHMLIHHHVQKAETINYSKSIHPIESDVDTRKLFIPVLD